MRACRENPRANPNRPDGGDLPNARRGARARSGCGSVAYLLPRTNDSRIRARKSGWGQNEDRSRLLRLQAGESSVRERSVVLGRSARRVTAWCAALGFFVLPQLYATAFVEVHLAATVRSPACDDQGSHRSLPAQLSGEFRQAVSRTRLVRSGGDAFRTAAHCGVTNDAEGEGQSGATQDADRARRVARQSSSQPTYAALPGNGKARPRALPFGLQALLVFPGYDVCGWCNENLTRKATMLGAVHSDLNEEKKQKIDL